jgi:hypothetical protein
VFAAAASSAQQTPAKVKTTRLYIFDNGAIKGLDPKLFNFTREELKEVDFRNTSYLIVHPRGTLMFDSGGIPDGQFKGNEPATEGIMSATRPLLPQLKEPATHLPTSPTSRCRTITPITRPTRTRSRVNLDRAKGERDFMFSEKPEGIIQPATYGALKGAKTKVLNNEDFDVFGDGTVVIKSAPGHTPGHQVLFLTLRRPARSSSLATSITTPRNARRSRADVRIQRRTVESLAAEDRSVRQAVARAAVDRTRHRNSRQLAKAPQVSGVATAARVLF